MEGSMAKPIEVSAEQESVFSVSFSNFGDTSEPGRQFDGFGNSFNNFPPGVSKQTNFELLTCSDEVQPAKKAKSSGLHSPQKNEKDIKSELETLIQGLGDNSRELFFKLSPQFSHCESFEILCPQQLDDIIRDALAYEETLQQQKQRLITRLEQLSKTLQTK